MTKCITCNKQLNRNKAFMTISLNNVDYLLCCPLCQSEFERDPDKFIRQLNKKHKK